MGGGGGQKIAQAMNFPIVFLASLLFSCQFYTVSTACTVSSQGCLHHKLRRHHVALHYFQKALQALGREEAKTAENGTTARGGAAGGGGGSSGGRDGHVSPAPICEVLYNTGLQLLITENPEEVR